MKNKKIYLAPVDHIKANGTVVKEGFVVHFIDGRYFCYQDRCPHKPEEGDLRYGTFCPLDMTVECERHKFKFCLKSGKNTKDPLQKYGNLELFDVYEDDGNLYVKVS